MRSSMGSMAGMIAMLGAGLAGGAPELPKQLRSYSDGARSRGHEYRPARIGSSPKAARHWHEPKDPAQAKRIAAAQLKRERKAEALLKSTLNAYMFNRAHVHDVNINGLDYVPPRLNPFSIEI